MPYNVLDRDDASVSPGRSSPTARRGLLAVMSACVVLVVAMVAAINLAVPMLAASGLRPSGSALIWIVDTYVIFFACLVIPGGAAGDRFGRKGVLLTGLLLFAAGALLSAVAPNVALMLVGRALTGVGAAAVLPNTLAVLLHAVPAERKGAAIATWASMTGIGGMVGNVGGGAVLTGGSWRWLFLAVVPIALALAALVALIAPVSARHDRDLDPLGTVLLVGASVALLLGIVQGPETGWGSAVVVGGFVCAAVLFALWTIVELRARHPLLDPRLFLLPGLRSACLGMTTVFFGMFALFYVNASLMQYGMGFGVLETGLGIIPASAPIMLGGRYVGRLSRRIGVDATVALAFACTGSALLGLSTTDTHTPYPIYAAWLVVNGIGITLALPTLSAAIATSLPHAQAGVGAGLQATTREFGSALGVAVIGTVLTARFVAALPADIRAAHDPHTVAQALAVSAPGRAPEIVAAFVSGADLGLRIMGMSVLVLGALVVAQSLLSRRARNRR
ncbi:MFS transporter [Nocardia pseudobrasiliensis]|uniref:Putative MFS family arabinose efflux permease n=1 Tax=Nocardia pseudobrasiliensis TaxID=45979 RepID=A0A370HYQ3_9NOCA|nr:MFS transporter [Nocardia pseudobrasiliensis]RDI63643.1 putative MFS family arabinose efflux permease [Nocardia pseudobrasiliensis]